MKRWLTLGAAALAATTLIGFTLLGPASAHITSNVGHTFKHGVSAGFLADLVAAPDETAAVRALVARAAEEVKGGADALILLPPRTPGHRRALVRAGFAPTNKKLRFIGKTLHDDARLDEDARAWHFTLGDFDFF